MRQYRLIIDQPMAGARTMAVDEAIMGAVVSGDALPTLRFYTWDPPCLSLGYGQRYRDVDEDGLAAQGWHVVRRVSGGRAILHTDEVTYSLALPETHPLADGGILPSYRRISRALVAGVNRLGVYAAQADEQPDKPAQIGPVCFEVPSHYEITTPDGRKLIGSAQLRRRGGLLQHGSLPLAGDLARICDALTYDNAIEREEARFFVRQRAATLEEALGGVRLSADAVVQALADAFAETFDAELIPGALTAAEQAHADHLEREVYGNLEWTQKRI